MFNDDGPGTTNEHVVDLNGQEPTSSSSQQQQQKEQQGEIQIASSSSPSQHQQNSNNNSNENSSSSRNIVDKFTQRIASFAQRRNANNTPTNQDTNTETTKQVMNSSSHYLTPLPKIDWQVEPTDKLGELYEDILIYMFQFLQPNELIKMGSLNKRMRDIAGKDEVWSPVYKSHTFEGVTKDNTITHEFKLAFMTYYYMMRTIVEGRKHALRELPSFKTRQTCFQFSYGLLAPQVFLITFLIFLILVPLLMDEFIDISMVGYCSLPFFFALGVYFFISISLLLDPYFLQPKRKQYLEAISDSTTVRKDYAFNPKDEDSINLFIWQLWIWLIFILMFISKYIWFAALSAPFTALFVPCYVFCIVYCFAPLCFYFKKRRPFAYRGKIVFGFAYLLNSVIVAGSALQILLIGLKLDGIITTYWNLVFIPAWLFLLHVNCVCFYYTLCAAFAPSHEFSYSFCYNILGVLNYLVFVLFYQVWFIIFALRLDNVFISAFTYLFIPLWIFMIVVLSLHFCCAGGSLVLTSRFFDEEYEEMMAQKLQA